MFLLTIITSLFLDSAATETYLQGLYQQSSMPIFGTQDGGFSIHAQSIYDISHVSRVFGEASYTWGQSEGNKWVENADYELLYPYLTCDTIGGGLRTEQYYFRGGYRWGKEHLLWHLALQYRALQSYRSIDPRPKNKVADLQIDGSIGYIDSRYAYNIIGRIGRYKQNNDISFYSELGNTMLFHLVQPDEDYARFAGDFTSAYYHGITAGGGLSLQPLSTGWLAGIDYHYLSVTKELKSATSTPIARLRTHTAEAAIGYATPLWRVQLHAAYTLRQGTQYIYGEVTGNYYHLLFTSTNYLEQQITAGLSASYRWNTHIGYLRLIGDIDYLHKLPTTSSTEHARNYFDNLATHLRASQLTATLSLRYAFPIAHKYAWFFQPTATYTYYTSQTYRWQVALLTGLCF